MEVIFIISYLSVWFLIYVYKNEIEEAFLKYFKKVGCFENNKAKYYVLSTIILLTPIINVITVVILLFSTGILKFRIKNVFY